MVASNGLDHLQHVASICIFFWVVIPTGSHVFCLIKTELTPWKMVSTRSQLTFCCVCYASFFSIQKRQRNNINFPKINIFFFLSSSLLPKAAGFHLLRLQVRQVLLTNKKFSFYLSGGQRGLAEVRGVKCRLVGRG